MPDSTEAPAAKTVLVADDDPSLLKILELALRHAGYAVTTAVDGAVALERLEGRTYDLLVLDILMPGATGWEVLAKAVGATAPGEPLPRAILVTGFHQEYVVDMRVLQEEGVGAMMLKPFSPADLVEEAARVLAARARTARVRSPAAVPRSG